MLNCKPVATPIDTKAKLPATDGSPVTDAPFYRLIVGALQYLTLTRPKLQRSPSAYEILSTRERNRSLVRAVCSACRFPEHLVVHRASVRARARACHRRTDGRTGLHLHHLSLRPPIYTPVLPLSNHSPAPHTLSLSPPLWLLHERHAELAQVPGRLGGRERLRLAHHRRGGHPARRRPEPHHRHRHRRNLGHRRRDGPRAGPARRPARAPRAQPQGGRGDPRPHPRRPRGRRPRRRPRRGAPPRPLLPRLRPPLRRPLPRPPPPPQPPHKQRGAVCGAVRGVGGRRGDDLRHQLPGPLPAHEPAAGDHGGHGQGHRRAGPRRQRLLHRACLVRRRRRRRRAPRLPPPCHPQGHAVRSDAGLRAVQARQRAPHHGPRRPAQGDGRRRHRQLRPPRHRPDPPHPRPRRPRHQHGLLPGVQAPQDGPPGGGDDVLRGGAPSGGGGVGEVLRGLQRGGAVEAGVQRRGGLQAVELLRGHHRREGEGEGDEPPRHQLQVPGPELQRRPRHGHRLGIRGP